MKFTEDQYHGYIVATEFRFPETSGCVKVGETDTTAEGIEFKVTLEGREFKVGLFPFPDHIHASILTQAGTNQYDTAQFQVKPSGETESEKAENVVKLVIQQCQAYLDTLKMIQQSAHETIKAELCNDLEHIVGSDAEKKALMNKVEGHVRTELEKFGLVSKCKFEQFDADGLFIVSAAIGENIIAKAIVKYHNKSMQSWIHVNEITVATRPVE